MSARPAAKPVFLRLSVQNAMLDPTYKIMVDANLYLRTVLKLMNKGLAQNANMDTGQHLETASLVLLPYLM